MGVTPGAGASAGGGSARGVVVGCATSRGSGGSGLPNAISAVPALHATPIADGADGGAEYGHAGDRPAVPAPSMSWQQGDWLPMVVDRSARTGPLASLAFLVCIAEMGLADLGRIWMRCWKLQGSQRGNSWAPQRAFCLLAAAVVLWAGVLEKDQPKVVEQTRVLMVNSRVRADLVQPLLPPFPRMTSRPDQIGQLCPQQETAGVIFAQYRGYDEPRFG